MSIASESPYYRLILKEGMEKGLLLGKAEEARRMILRQGQIRFRPPAEEVRKAIGAIEDIDRLEQLGDRVVAVSSWTELLAETGANGGAVPQG
jgi:hypothetical protein